MTTGSVIRDDRSTVIVYLPPLGYTSQIGKYYRKSWSGGDKSTPRLAGGSPFYREITDEVTRREFDTFGRAETVTRTSRLRRDKSKALGKSPKLLPNGYSMSFTESFDSLGRAVLDESVGGPADIMVTSFWLFGTPPFSVPWDSNDDLRTLGKLREAVAGSDFNFGVFLAEGREALSMIFNAATRINKSINALRRGNLVKAWKSLVDDKGGLPRQVHASKPAAQNWLAMQYGWMPLLKDAESGAEFLAHLSSVPVRQRVVARTKKSATPTPHPNGYYAGYTCYRTQQIIAYLEEVNVVALSGLTDPASIVWEKVPFSFIADWFVPIGSFLSARGLASSLKATYVKTDITRMKTGGFVMTNRPPSLKSVNLGASRFIRVEMTRTVSSNLSVPLPTVKPLEKVASWRHVANAVALVVSSFR